MASLVRFMIKRTNFNGACSIFGGKQRLYCEQVYKPPFANEPEDYRRLIDVTNRERQSQLESTNRFQRISERQDRTNIPLAVNMIKRCGKFKPLYRGVLLLKCPEDLLIYHQLFWYLKPPTVIELGSNTGGMAIWIADTLKLMDVSCQIYSMDLDLTLLSPDVLRVKPDNVKFLQGDCYALDKTFTPDFLKGLPHPWVIIDDAHVNMPNVLEYFHKFMKVGDYVIVEDTDPTFVPRVGEDKNRFESTGVGPELLDQLKSFLVKYENQYSVDSFLTDMFGYNGTWNWHGFIRRMN